MICKQARSWTPLLLLVLVFGIQIGGAVGSARAQDRTSRSKLSDHTAQTLFVRGLTQSYLEDYEEAISLFEEALKASPQQPAILSALAEAEAERGNLTSAIYYAREARTNAPTEPYYYLALADVLQEADRPEEATSVYRALLSRAPAHSEARLKLARLQAELNAPRKALRTYEALIDSTDRPQPQAYAEMLPLYQQVGDDDGLERTLRALIDLRNDTPRYRELLGQLYTKQDRYEEAIPLFETLVQEHPSNPRLLSRLKMLYTETGQPQKAETVGASASTNTAPSQLVARARSLYNQTSPSDTSATETAVRLLQQALDTAPKQVDALSLLGTIYFDQGDYAAAASLLQNAIDVNPRDPDRWWRAASAHLRADSARQAASLAEEGRLLFPGRYDLARVEGFARLRLGEFDAALTHFEAARTRMDTTAISASERASLHAGVGRAHHQLGNVEDAHAAYETALRLNPRAPMALREYAYSLAEQAMHLDRALALAQRAVDVAGRTPETLSTLGWVHFKRDNYAEATTAYENALSAGDASAQVYEHFGDLQRALGNESQAQAYWRKALDRDPDRASVKQKLNSGPQS